MTLIAEDLLLLLLDDEKGDLRAATQAPYALGGALLAELALDGSVTIGEKKGFWGQAKVTASGPPPADPVLAEAHATVAAKERAAADLVPRLGKGLKETLTQRLVAQGLLEEHKDRVLGFIPRTRWPAADSAHEDEVRRALAATLLQGQPPAPRVAALVALLSAIDQAPKVIEHDGLPSREIRKRAKEIAKGDGAAKGVSDAIEATNAAVVAAIAATSAATAATAGGGS